MGSKKHFIVRTVLLTILIEAITVFNRFVLGLTATRDTASTLGVLTGGVRIHHGYIGLLLIIVAAAIMRRRPAVRRWLLSIGAALVCGGLAFLAMDGVAGDGPLGLRVVVILPFIGAALASIAPFGRKRADG